MNEINEDPARSVQNGKRRRLQGSCDKCKKRKVRCDSAEMPGNRCTNCITSNSECMHSPKTVEGPSSSAQVHKKTTQELVATILSTSTVYVPPHDLNSSHKILVEVAQYARSLEEKLVALQSQPLAPISQSDSSMQYTDDTSSPRASEGGTRVATGENMPIEDVLGRLTPSRPREIEVKVDRFYGQFSSLQFTKAAVKHMHGTTPHVVGVRPEFWTTQPWEKITIEPSHLIFPDIDLLEALVKIYFEKINPILGILHFPSFQQSISDGLHFRDSQFGAVLLAACSLASRHSDDPRVFFEGVNSEHSCGWKWFRQVQPLRASFSPEPSLYQLQLISLSAIYLSGTSTPEECWILAGLGIRFAQGSGAHHRSGYNNVKPLTAELYKRVFWLLVISDTLMSSFKGRPSITQPADFDLDLPVDCDEEYWGVPDAVQPAGKPSTSAFMPVYVQLMLIFARIQRAVYPVNEQMCSENVIVELDSALNQWVDGIPEHLRWDPNQQNQIFLDQSATLFATYYHAQILIHRHFIPTPGKQSTSKASFPSLAICANAARSCGHVLAAQARRGRGLLHYPGLMTALFDSAIVLLINVWAIVGGSKSRTSEDFIRATADAQNCVRVLRLYERRWRIAGRNCDIIDALLNIGQSASNAHLKRLRDDEDDVSAPPNFPEISVHPAEVPITGSSTLVAQQMQELERSIEETGHLFSLPLHTEELGRLPVYDSFHYEFTFNSNDIHYQPQSYLNPPYDVSDPIPPQLLRSVDPALDSIFPMQQAETAGVGDVQLPPVLFDIPSGYGWQDWSTYLTSVDGLNQRTF
ncbi:fungal-specific transcription factor domain-containing protein [Mycena leptocephala]|nr:fungal-specific transcription factor domain-containing protein [Mycena leptocephala]